MSDPETHDKYSTMEQPWWANDGLILVLTLLSIGIILYDFEYQIPVYSNLWWVLACIDACLIAFFVADLLEDYGRCNDKGWWMKRHGWEFIGLVPMIIAALPFLSSAPMLRLLRLTRAFNGIFRLIGASRRSNEITIHRQVLHLLLIVAVLILAGAFFVYIFEKEYYDNNCNTTDPPDVCSNVVNNFPSAIWWAFVTTTTVGYGDLSPVTWPARIVASGLMMIGIGLVGTLAATLSQLFYSTKMEITGADETTGDTDVLEQLERFAEYRRSGLIDEETYVGISTILIRRIHLELRMLRVELEGISSLPMMLQVAAKMNLIENIKDLEDKLVEAEVKVTEEE